MKIIYSFLIAVLLSPLFSSAQETNIFMDYSNLEVGYFKNGDGEYKLEATESAVLGINTTVNLSKSIDLIGAVGISKGFDYRFLSSNLGLKLTSNFNINFGCGMYAIDDARWEPQGLDGEQPSNYEFGLNAGLLWDITDNLGLSIKYNMIEAVAEDRQEGVRKMSINGWALGITFRSNVYQRWKNKNEKKII
jgi:opacity protein-like surface antigen